jgi:SAM-dependent methyltransferase
MARLVAVKEYDRVYFEHWYHSRAAVVTPESRQRKVHLAVAAAEFVLGREIRSVLDVGCGEGRWRAVLKRLRPGVRYVGVDSSEYVVQRHGVRRGIRLGSVGTLGRLGLRRPFDLIVCADVIAYVSTPEMHRGLLAIRKLLRGVAYIEVFTTEDDFIGDRDHWHYRTEATYRKAFRQAGLIACGLNCWVSQDQEYLLSSLEKCG